MGCRGAEAVAWRNSFRSVHISFASPHAPRVQDITYFGNRCELGTINTQMKMSLRKRGHFLRESEEKSLNGMPDSNYGRLEPGVVSESNQGGTQ